MDESKRYELEEFLQELSKYRGRHTELITVYVPQGYSLLNIAKQLDQEKSTAMNIKSKGTRKNVLDALERLTRHLRLIDKNPENGLALFAGNISDNESQVDIEVWSIEPPAPLRVRLYRCDQEFVLDPLKEMLEVTEVYGLVVIEINEATIGVLEGKQVRVIQHMTSGVPGKTEKGGQSAARYARIREGMRKEFYRRVADAIKTNFWDMKKLKGIIVGGPGPTKEYFLKEGQIVTALREKIMGVKDIGYADEHGLGLLVEASKDLLSEQEITREKKILEDFLTNLAKNPNKTVYGLEDVKKALKVGAVQILIMDKKLDKKAIKEYREMADNISAKVEIVSEETEEGQQFKSLGGIGAILRFDIGLR
jgi:peptide chain release factor subunit 1